MNIKNWKQRIMNSGLLLAVLFSSMTAVTPAIAGDKEGNGGGGIAIEFALIGREAAQALWAGGYEDYAVRLTALINSNTVDISDTTRSLVVRGKSRDCVNSPPKKTIICSASTWQRLQDPKFEQKRSILVLHEYLSILGIERDGNYSVSTATFSGQRRYAGRGEFSSQDAYEFSVIRSDSDGHQDFRKAHGLKTFWQAGAFCGFGVYLAQGLGGDTISVSGEYIDEWNDIHSLGTHNAQLDSNGSGFALFEKSDCVPAGIETFKIRIHGPFLVPKLIIRGGGLESLHVTRNDN